MDYPIGLDPSHVMTQRDMNERQLAEDIGDKWRDLARALYYSQAVIDAIQKEQGNSIKECCIAVLVGWMEQEGHDATVEKLAKALTTIKLKNVADKLMGPWPGKPCVDIKDNVESYDSNQIDKLQKTISEMQTNCKHLEEEGLKVRARIKELEQKLSNATQKNRDVQQEGSRMRARIEQLEKQLQDADKRKYDAEQECSKLRARIVELEEDIAASRSGQQQRDSSQENLDNFVDHTQEYISDATSNDLDTDQTREHIINVQLKNLQERLDNNVTSLLRVPEVKEDKLKTSVKLDLLTRLSESLQEMYSEIQRMVAPTCKCKEDLKREFYDFAYHGLRAEHNDLVHRVNDLESALAEMSDEEKKEFERLQTFQNNRRRQVEKLEKFWRRLFNSPESLPEKTCSAPCGGGDKSKKASRRKTDLGARQKQVKPLEQATSSGTSDDTKFKPRTLMKRFFKKKESNDNTCHFVSYSHRDS